MAVSIAAFAASVMLAVLPAYSQVPAPPSRPAITVGEEGCLTGRADLERRRRGDHGVINADVLLERTRAFQRVMLDNGGNAIPGTKRGSLGPTKRRGHPPPLP